MLAKGRKFNEISPNQEHYLSAFLEFTQMTINNPSFFEKTPDEQKEMAMATIQNHKAKLKKEIKED